MTSPGHWLEALGLRLAMAVFGALSLDRASALGGWLGRSFGPWLSVSTVARGNLARAFPEKFDDEITVTVRAMWDNLGRVAAEYAHLGDIEIYGGDGRVEIIGAEIIEQLRDDGIGGIFVAAHLGNWEITPLAASQKDLALTQIYRAANNPLVEPILRRLRAPLGGDHVPKGTPGARKLIQALRRGEHLAIVADQKQNDGIPVPLFGRDAMTAPALAQLALKFQCPVVPTRVERLGGARFRLTVYPPLDLPASGDHDADVAETMRRINALFEDWIRERPEQWLWLHRRWPDEN
jgi:KDO2-lipid IV(A) lauroyltransferase